MASCDVRYLKIPRWRRGTIEEIEEILASRRCGEFYVQALRSDLLASRRILIAALARSLRAFRKGRPISRKVSTEILLRLCGERSIASAIKNLGPGEGQGAILVVIVCGRCREEPLGSLLGLEETWPGSGELAPLQAAVLRMCCGESSEEDPEAVERVLMSCGARGELE